MTEGRESHMKKLIVAEKKMVGDMIAKVVGATTRGDGFVEGPDYVVSWCRGHLVDNKMPEDYERFRGDDYKFPGTIKVLPIIPEPWELKVDPDGAKQLAVLKKLCERSDIGSLVEATDAGREGELIFRLVYRYIGCKKPFERLWISSLEPSAIKAGMQSLKPSSAYDNLYSAALSRSRADWLFGINGTRFYTLVSTGGTRSVGRVQTPTLAMVVKRDEEIDNFKVEKRWAVVKDFGDWKLETEKFTDEQKAKECLAATDGKPCKVTKVEKAKKKQGPPLLHSLSTLQQEANNKFGYTADQTLAIMQDLYLGKIITYPRTDSNYVTEADAPMLTRIVDQIGGRLGPRIPGWKSMGVKRVVDGSKVGDHHAVLITESFARNPDVSSLSEEKKNIVRLVQARILEAVAPWYEYEQTKVSADCAGYEFLGTGNRVLAEGWRRVAPALFGKEMKVPGMLPEDIAEGKSYNAVKTGIESRDTEPPLPYTEATLLAAMERAGAKEMDDEVERKGLGTSATRADTIEKLLRMKYIYRKGKQLRSTDSGKRLIAEVDNGFKDVGTTVEWENRLLQMEKGKGETLKTFCDSVVSTVSNLLKESPLKQRAEDGRPLGTCPVCGGQIVTHRGHVRCGSCNRMLYRTSQFFDYNLSDEDISSLLGGGSLNTVFHPKDPKKKPMKVRVRIDAERSSNDPKYLGLKMEFLDPPKKKPVKKGKK